MFLPGVLLRNVWQIFCLFVDLDLLYQTVKNNVSHNEKLNFDEKMSPFWKTKQTEIVHDM